MSRPEDDRRTAWGRDRNPTVYARRRAQGIRRRDAMDRRAYDPRPPTEDDWVLHDRSQVVRVTRTPELLGDVLDGLVRDRRWGERLRGSQVFDRWEQVVGSSLARHCRPVRLAGGVLTVAASSPRWATQLRYLTGQLARNVNVELGEPVVETVNVVVRRDDQD